MFENIRLAAIGSATVLDAVLLIALLEKPNRRHVAVWMWWMTGATLAFHAGSFAHHLLTQAETDWAVTIDWAAMMVMCCGLMVLPAGILHGCLRLTATGLNPAPARDLRYALLYLPVLVLIPVASDVDPGRSRDFLLLVDSFVRPYGLYFLASTIVAAICYARLRSKPEFAAYRRFLAALSITLVVSGLVTLAGTWYGVHTWPRAADVITLAMALAPMTTVVLFIYYVMRFGLLSLLVERSMVYGGIVITFLLVHELVFADLRDQLSNRFRINFAVVEGIAAVSLILLYAPLRQRAAEGLRYLAGRRIEPTRVQTRDLSARMTSMTGLPTQQVLNSVANNVGEAFRLSDVRLILLQPEPIRSENAIEEHSSEVSALANHMRASGERYATIRRSDDARVLSCLDTLGAVAGVLIEHRDIFGIMLAGAIPESVGDEELNALVLLAEQLAVTLQLERMQAERIAAERRAVQQEKLSTLGLLAGSIAHEVRNPLSSIKAITTVMAEDLGEQSEHAEDLQLILGEIDRLATTTSQLLAFARSEPQARSGVCPAEVLQQTLQLMRHVAKRDGIEITTDIAAAAATVSADINALREIYFNLLKNSLEAAGPGGMVGVTCIVEDDHIVTRVCDNGPGIAAEIQDRLFEPFATTKADGTGLGLYIVGRHVRELGGEIQCETTADSGTEFTLKLPTHNPPQETK